MSPEPAALEFSELEVAAGPAPCIDGVSLRIPVGEFHGLLGPNGAGKTTLLRTLYFANRPRRGTIKMMGRAQDTWRREDWSRTMGVLVQGGGLLAGLTIRDIIDIGLKPLNLDTDLAAHRAEEALRIVGLRDLADRMAVNLSGGELQRAYFAQLLARDPEVYVLDEPTNHLDLHYQLALLDEVKRRGKTVLATLHDLSMAGRYCDRVSLMDAGRIVATGPIDTVLTAERIARTYRVRGEMRDGVLDLAGPLYGAT